MILEAISKDRPNFTTDLDLVDRSTTSIAISDKTRGLSFIQEFNFKKVWLICVNQKAFEKIIPHISPEYLNLYGCRVKDLSLLETLTKVETIVNVWNTKTLQFWDFSKNKNLKQLYLGDLTKVNTLEDLAKATSVEDLQISGGMGSNWKVSSLAPLASLTNLKSLSLSAMNVADKSLQPLSSLVTLEELAISNQFSTAEFARLSTQLKNTSCDKFSPFSSACIEDGNGTIVADIMITGSRKPFLHSKKDTEKIAQYVQKFNKLVASFT
ncbi:hypothetical protein [uncultured Kordia sp.]|uniref:hypothetical protein n=1 Tax=uncultured Kordia sp. TaxID=507699 RepID=UPI0026321CE3|nr:hypothetical protein [uncultured Kordia sp.]